MKVKKITVIYPKNDALLKENIAKLYAAQIRKDLSEYQIQELIKKLEELDEKEK